MTIHIITTDYQWSYESSMKPSVGVVVRHPEKGDYKVLCVRMVLERHAVNRLLLGRIECEAVKI